MPSRIDWNLDGNRVAPSAGLAARSSRKTANLPNPTDVGPMTSNDLRCPQCSAHVPPGADWCALCFADLRSPAEPEPAAAPALAPVEPAPAHESAAEQAADPEQYPVANESGGGKHARSAPTYDEAFPRPNGVPLDDAARARLDTRTAEMLAMLAAAESSQPLGPLAARFESTSSRAIGALVGSSFLILAVLLGMTILGHFI
jgi:hypothetical protein